MRTRRIVRAAIYLQDEGRLLAWQTTPAGTEPKGWQWVWQLQPYGPDSTEVRLTYDWSNVTDQELLKKVSFPLVKEDQLEESPLVTVPGTC